MKRVIYDQTGAGLLDKIYKNEGWTRKEGEVRSRRVVELYTIERQHNRYRAERKKS